MSKDESHKGIYKVAMKLFFARNNSILIYVIQEEDLQFWDKECRFDLGALLGVNLLHTFHKGKLVQETLTEPETGNDCQGKTLI